MGGGPTEFKFHIRIVLSSDAEHKLCESDAHATSEIPCECPSNVASYLPSSACQILIVLSAARTTFRSITFHFWKKKRQTHSYNSWQAICRPVRTLRSIPTCGVRRASTLARTVVFAALVSALLSLVSVLLAHSHRLQVLIASQLRLLFWLRDPLRLCAGRTSIFFFLAGWEYVRVCVWNIGRLHNQCQKVQISVTAFLPLRSSMALLALSTLLMLLS